MNHAPPRPHRFADRLGPDSSSPPTDSVGLKTFAVVVSDFHSSSSMALSPPVLRRLGAGLVGSTVSPWLMPSVDIQFRQYASLVLVVEAERRTPCLFCDSFLVSDRTHWHRSGAAACMYSHVPNSKIKLEHVAQSCFRSLSTQTLPARIT